MPNRKSWPNLATPSGSSATIELAVVGTDDLGFVELLRWDGIWQGGHPVFRVAQRFLGSGATLEERFTDAALTGDVVCYARVKQLPDVVDADSGVRRQIWGWTSPVTVIVGDT